jgi:hypothetical protein
MISRKKRLILKRRNPVLSKISDFYFLFLEIRILMNMTITKI